MARAGQAEQVVRLIAEGANIEESTVFGRAPLHWAAMHGHVPVMKVLLDAGARVDAANAAGGTPPLPSA